MAELEHVGMSSAANCASSLVRLWHFSDMTRCPSQVCMQSKADETPTSNTRIYFTDVSAI